MNAIFIASMTFLAACVPSDASSAALEPATSLRVIESFKVGGDGGWDFLTLDAESRHLYVTRGDHVMVVDADTGKLLADIAGANHSHGVALVPALKRGYISNGRGDSVSVFDLDALRITADIPVGGSDPDVILFDPATRHVFAFNGHSNDVSVIDPALNKVIAKMDSPGRPEFAVSDGAGNIFFNIEDKATLVRADAISHRMLDNWPLRPCEGPTGLAIDVAHQRLFSVCANRKLVVVDAQHGRIVQTLTIGEGPDAAAFDPSLGLVYSSNADGTLTVIHQDDADHYRVVANVATPKRSRTMALDPKTHRIYLGAAEFAAAPNKPGQAETKPTMIKNSFKIVVVGQQ